jgi:hypothetical protein
MASMVSRTATGKSKMILCAGIRLIKDKLLSEVIAFFEKFALSLASRSLRNFECSLHLHDFVVGDWNWCEFAL